MLVFTTDEILRPVSLVLKGRGDLMLSLNNSAMLLCRSSSKPRSVSGSNFVSPPTPDTENPSAIAENHTAGIPTGPMTPEVSQRDITASLQTEISNGEFVWTVAR